MIELLLQNIEKYIKDYLTSKNISDVSVEFEKPKVASFGDYATNVAMKLASKLHNNPRAIALELVNNIDKEACHLSKVEIAGAGFINFMFDRTYLAGIIHTINQEGSHYGDSTLGGGKKVDIEFVSANPTGYLHVGHGRGAAYGDSLARVMTKAGYNVTKEYYVNDGGNQIHNLAESIYQRYRELYGFTPLFGENSYHGQEIITVAKKIQSEKGDYYLNHPYEEDFKAIGTEYLLDFLRKDLSDFHVNFDVWFHEKSLYQNGDVAKTIRLLKDKGATYEEEGATWLRTTDYGDEKDRVLIKSDGTLTYLTPDISYHMNKLARGFDELVDVFGADHHGYIPRLKASIAFLGGDPDKLDVEILQMVRAMQNGEEVKMSKRSGKAITLRDLMEEVGTDALRWFYESRALSSQMDLDLTLAAKQSTDNPVYYVQYAYARIASVFRVYASQGKTYVESDLSHLDPLSYNDLLLTLLRFPEVINESAKNKLPHVVANYIYELANNLHVYYAANKIITDNNEETLDRLTLLKAVQIVLKEGLNVLGLDVKEQM